MILACASLISIKQRVPDWKYGVDEAIAERRFGAEEKVTTTLYSTGLHCPSCVMKIETALKAMDGVSRAKVHFTTGRIVVDHDPKRTTSGALARTIRAVGYDARTVGTNG